MPRKPGFWITTNETRNDYRMSNRKTEAMWVEAPTYRELKKKIKEMLPLSVTDEISVYRERRGEWGEWFERWELVSGKPKIVKESWM